MDRLLPWLRRTSTITLIAAIVLAVVVVRSVTARARTEPADTPVAARVVSPPRAYLVHVAGAVRRPGVYRIGGDGRIIQAIRLAGGPLRKANLDAVNLAAPVQDGQQIVVPVRAGPGGGPPGGSSPGPISLASATVDQLEALDGIGPTLAGRIVAWRDEHGGFQSIDQLTDVPGIGATRLESLRPHLTP